MALLTASDLHKDIAGRPLLRGVSFRLERRTRMTLAGRNGAGKTTLLRMLAGESAIDRGELNVAKGARVALHDQRPPRERAIALREYVLSGCAEELQIERELAQLEASMAAGDADETLLSRYARAQARLETRGGYLWRDRANAMAHGLGFAEEDLERPLGTAIEAQRGEIVRMERFIERFRYKASKARQAQSRVKRLQKMQRIERDPRAGRSLEFSFATPQRSGRVIFELDGGRIEVGGGAGIPAGPARDGSDGSDGSEGRDGYDGNGRGGPLVLLDGVELWLERGEHVS